MPISEENVNYFTKTLKKLDYISSEEEGEEGKVARRLSWESVKLSNLKKDADKAYIKSIRNDRVLNAIQLPFRNSTSVSLRGIPKGCPRWAKKE